MKPVTYVALLRGINVGGNHIIRMTDLKACFEKMGMQNVVTYIQSGNVMFVSTVEDSNVLALTLEKGIAKRFGFDVPVVLVSHKQLENAVEQAPKGFGSDLVTYRCDVIFLKRPVTPKQALAFITVKEGVDDVHAGREALYFSRLVAKASQSRLPKIMGTPIYKSMTIRNWNTTTKLLAMMDAAKKASLFSHPDL